MRVLQQVLLGIVLMITCGWSLTRGNHKEKYYQDKWALEHNAITSITLPDRTEVDIIWGEYAIEVEFAYKWAESVGQALYYAAKTNKNAGILIIANKGDARFVQHLKDLIKYHNLNITIWEIPKE